MKKLQAIKTAEKLIGKTLMWVDYLNGDVNNKCVTSYDIKGVGDCGGHTIALQTIQNNVKDYLLWMGHDNIKELDRVGIVDIHLPSGTLRRIFTT